MLPATQGGGTSDELGTFLEFAAHNPQQQDVFLLQRLAELAAASDKAAPMFLVGMLHQGFDAYAENLDPSTQREWEKPKLRRSTSSASCVLLRV
jgi:hypothetical protein